jgi:hypothetical protein
MSLMRQVNIWIVLAILLALLALAGRPRLDATSVMAKGGAEIELTIKQ